MTFRTTPRRGYHSTLNVDPPINSYLKSLGAIAIYDGTLNGGSIANLGTAGSAIDGVPTDVIIDANGMNFNGTTSRVVIPNHASWVNLTSYTYLAIALANSVGENAAGRIWTIGSLGYSAFLNATPLLAGAIDRATDATTAYNGLISAYPSTRFINFMSWDGASISGHAARVNATKLTAGANSNGSGALTAIGTNTLFLGNRNGSDRTWDGYIKLFAIIPYVLGLGTRTRIARVANVII